MTLGLRATRTCQQRDELVERFLPLVRYVVARLPVAMPVTLDRDDFYSAGVMGLMHAAATWDPDRGASFKTFAYTAIRGAVLDEIRKHDPVPRSRRDRLREHERARGRLAADLGREPTLEELAEYLGVAADTLDDDLLALHTCKVLSLDDSSGGGHEGGPLSGGLVSHATIDPGDAAERQEMVEQLARAISELPDVERHVVVLYHYEDLYLKEIGRILGVTESRVSQILSRAMRRLQDRLRREVVA